MNLRTFFLLLLSTIGLIGHSSVSLGSSLLTDVNDEAFKFEYMSHTSGLGYNASILAHEDDGSIFAFGAQVQGATLQDESISGALGGKFYYIDLDNDISGTAIGLGGSLALNLTSFEGFSLIIDAYYAPGVLAFSDIDHHTDISVRGVYQVLRNGSVYLGFRKAHIDAVRGISGNLDNGLHLGLKLSF